MRRPVGNTVAFVVALAMSATVSWPSAVAAEDALERALSLAAEERYSEARRVLDPLLERAPDSREGRLLHGILRVQEDRRSEAIDVFSELAQEFSDMFEAHNNLAVLYAEEGRLEDARGVLLGILERRPSAVGYRNLADIYGKLARRAHVRSRELDPGTSGDGGQGPDADTASAGTTVEAASTPASSGTDVQEATGEPGKAGKGAPAPVADDSSTCVAAGEFTDKDLLEKARQWLEDQGAEVARVARGTREMVKNYWVYLPPFDSRKSAVAMLRALRSRGVKDAAIVTNDAMKNAISLGVYAIEANSKRRVARLEKLGYSPVRAPYRMETLEYATIEAHIGGGYDALGNAWSARFRNQPLRKVECR